MKEIENNIIEGWTIYPPENTHKARAWIKTIEAMSESVKFSGGQQSDLNEKKEIVARLS